MWIGAAVASAAVQYLAASSSFYFSDDYLNFARARELGFTSAWLNSDLFGHWLPGRKALDWIVGAWWPVSWELGLAILAAFSAVAAVFTAMVVRLLTGSHAWALVAALFLPLSGAMVGTVQWWAGAAQVVPALAISCAILWLGLIAVTSGTAVRVVSLAIIPPLLFAALVFDERAAVLALLSPLFTFLLPGRPRALPSVVTLYALIGLTLALWYAMQTLMTPDTPSTPPTPPAAFAAFMALGVVANSVPALVGWTAQSSAGLPWAFLPAGIVILLVVLFVLMAGNRAVAAKTTALFAAAVVGMLAPVGIVRVGEFGPSGAMEPRYVAMSAGLGAVLVVVLAQQAWPVLVATRWTRLAGALLAVAITSGTALNLVTVHERPAGRDARAWVDTFVASSERLGVDEFYNMPVSKTMVPSGFYPYNMTATVLPQIRTGTTVAVTSPRAGFIRFDGEVSVIGPTDRVAAVLVERSGVLRQDGECLTAGDTGARSLYRVPPGGSTTEVSVITVRGEFPDSAGVELRAGTRPDALRNKTTGIGGSPPTPGAALWVTTDEFPDLRFVEIDVAPDRSVCVSEIRVGSLPVSAR